MPTVTLVFVFTAGFFDAAARSCLRCAELSVSFFLKAGLLCCTSSASIWSNIARDHATSIIERLLIPSLKRQNKQGSNPWVRNKGNLLGGPFDQFVDGWRYLENATTCRVPNGGRGVYSLCAGLCVVVPGWGTKTSALKSATADSLIASHGTCSDVARVPLQSAHACITISKRKFSYSCDLAARLGPKHEYWACSGPFQQLLYAFFMFLSVISCVCLSDYVFAALLPGHSADLNPISSPATPIPKTLDQRPKRFSAENLTGKADP